MDYIKAMASIKRAVIAAIISAGVTVITTIVVLVTDVQLSHINLLSFIDAVVILGLAFGVSKKSRICAVLLLMYYAIGQMSVWMTMENFATLPMTILFCYFYVQGIRGTIAYHNFVIPENAEDGNEQSDTKAKSPVYGMVSLALGVMLFVAVLIGMVILGGGEATESVKIAAGLFVIVSVILSLVGVVLAVVGLIQKHRRFVFSVLGLIVNSVFIMLLIVSAVTFME